MTSASRYPPKFHAPTISVGRRLNQLLHDLIDAEALRPLSWRELLERSDDLRHDRLRSHHQEPMTEHPIIVCVRSDIRALIRVHAQVVEQRKPPAGERLAPDVERARGLLLAEHKLPVVDAQRHDVAVVVEVDEAPARGMVLLSGQVRELIVSVEMDLVGPVADLPTLRKPSL